MGLGGKARGFSQVPMRHEHESMTHITNEKHHQQQNPPPPPPETINSTMVYPLPEARSVPNMVPAGRLRLQDSSKDVDSKGITILFSYSMYLWTMTQKANRQQTMTRNNMISAHRRKTAIHTQGKGERQKNCVKP